MIGFTRFPYRLSEGKSVPSAPIYQLSSEVTPTTDSSTRVVSGFRK
jgi:hypothetical protein